MPVAFITGASGFIGGTLSRRLSSEGWTVNALARSAASADAVTANGAQPKRGDLSDTVALQAGMDGADVVFHAAAHLGDWGAKADFVRDNVDGTRNVLDAARAAGVARLVHVGTEAALMHGKPLIEVDEHAPLQPSSPALYSATKARAEALVIAAAGDGLQTVVIRPRLVWGKGDTTILPQLADAVRSGRFAWVGGGHHLTSTTHVDNVVEGLLLGAERGASGNVYFVTDGAPVVFREFISKLLGTQGLDPGTRSIPPALAGSLAAVAEIAWSTLPLPGRPPLTRLAYWLSAQECTIDISKARRDLHYVPVRSVDEGLGELSA
jgi:nucleoside-diphosphate-sugar epimerase